MDDEATSRNRLTVIVRGRNEVSAWLLVGLALSASTFKVVGRCMPGK